MTGPITRKIAIARQIEEMRALIADSSRDYPVKVRRKEMNAGLADERRARQAGILATLEFCAANEAAIRAYISQKGKQGAQ